MNLSASKFEYSWQGVGRHLKKMDEEEEISDLGQLKAAHRKERKELQSKIMNMKHSIAKTDKKRKKEVVAEIAKLEEEMKKRHEKELAELESSLPEASVETAVVEQHQEKEPRISKAHKRREKKAELNKKREEAAVQAMIDAESAPRKIESDAIEQQLMDRGLVIHNIEPDGDCLYSAVAHQLSLITSGQFKSEDIRQKAAIYMRTHKNDFLPFLIGEDGNTIDEIEFEEYSMKVEKCCRDGGVWGGEPELRAIACALERRIEVIQPGGRVLHFGEEYDDKKPLIITFHQFAYNLGEHYNSTVPNSESNICAHFDFCDSKRYFSGSKTKPYTPLTWKADNYGQITAEVEKLIDEGELPSMTRFWKAGQEDKLATRIVRKCCSEVDIDQFNEMKDVLKRSLGQIRGYRELCDCVEEMRKEKYDSGNQSHEKRLLKLWELLMPKEDLRARLTDQWQKIGFQSRDPASDFRGMGVLSLEQLIFLAQYDVAHAQSILSLSNHPLYGFPMAVTGINLTALVRRLLQDDVLKMHFYNTVRGAPTIDNFHHVFCQIFKLFCAFWTRRKPELVNFNFVKDDFEAQLVAYLYSEEANLDKLDIKFFE
uniref:OTU domain-containing protein n=1 Tax=Setaria digitata TaxID=48799 RepID=A0A915Q6W8_9BILA